MATPLHQQIRNTKAARAVLLLLLLFSPLPLIVSITTTQAGLSQRSGSLIGELLVLLLLAGASWLADRRLRTLGRLASAADDTAGNGGPHDRHPRG